MFPKLDKHLLGVRLLDDLDTCALAVLWALNDGARRRDHLMRASAHFDQFKLRLRVAVRREVITDRWYASQLDALAGIGKQLGGWQRAPPPQRS